ncbi:MAG: sulfatase-like hydrolase/transferase, partial [Verrucomicrobiales bacterium]
MPRLLHHLSLSLVALSASAAPPPNIVLIVADDLGYADLGCQGAVDFDTPHLDRLAASGTRLTNYCSAASTCSPSRAALLTGRYPDRIGLTEDLLPSPAVDADRSGPGSTGLPSAEITLAEILHQAGYA